MEISIVTNFRLANVSFNALRIFQERFTAGVIACTLQEGDYIGPAVHESWTTVMAAPKVIKRLRVDAVLLAGLSTF